MYTVKEFSVFKFPFRRTIDLYSGMQCGWVRVEAGTHATFNAEKHIYTHKAIIELDLSNRTLKSWACDLFRNCNFRIWNKLVLRNRKALSQFLRKFIFCICHTCKENWDIKNFLMVFLNVLIYIAIFDLYH